MCCKLEHIPAIAKPSNVLCRYCSGHDCTIYPDRPKPCADFRCLWLDDDDMGDELRPDRVHLYATLASANLIKVHVDTAHPEAWRGGNGQAVVEHASARAHVVVVTGRQLNFVPGQNLPMPEKLLVDWTL